MKYQKFYQRNEKSERTHICKKTNIVSKIEMRSFSSKDCCLILATNLSCSEKITDFISRYRRYSVWRNNLSKFCT